MTIEMKRRGFLAAGLGVAGAATLNLQPGIAEAAVRTARRGRKVAGYGPLIGDPNGMLDLPRGFRYHLVSESGVTVLETGEKTPNNPDGTGAFQRDGQRGYTLVNNHELGASSDFPVPHRDGFVYDQGKAMGGTTTLDLNARGMRVAERVSLAGTISNCAGGYTPWNTWMTCEETETKPSATNGVLKPHGYVFEVDPFDQEKNKNPQPIKAFGRFAHEAAVVDPDTLEVYLTEDTGNPNGLMYRWSPNGTKVNGTFKGMADDAGVLEAMICFKNGKYVRDLASQYQVGTVLDVKWKKVPDRDATKTSVRKQFDWYDTTTKATVPGEAGRITSGKKLEGACYKDGYVWILTSFARFSDGSDLEHDGQVWRFDPKSQTLKLIAWFPHNADTNTDPDGPDNIMPNPYGGFVVTEDGDGKNGVFGLTKKGDWYWLVRNTFNESEMVCTTFTPDAKFMTTAWQEPGHLFTVTGPWSRVRL